MRVYRAFFQEGRDIGSAEMLADLAAEVGLESGAVAAALRSGRYEKIHQAAMREAVDKIRIKVVPTIMVGPTRIEGVPTGRQIREAAEVL